MQDAEEEVKDMGTSFMSDYMAENSGSRGSSGESESLEVEFDFAEDLVAGYGLPTTGESVDFANDNLSTELPNQWRLCNTVSQIQFRLLLMVGKVFSTMLLRKICGFYEHTTRFDAYKKPTFPHIASWSEVYDGGHYDVFELVVESSSRRRAKGIDCDVGYLFCDFFNFLLCFFLQDVLGFEMGLRCVQDCLHMEKDAQATTCAELQLCKTLVSCSDEAAKNLLLHRRLNECGTIVEEGWQNSCSDGVAKNIKGIRQLSLMIWSIVEGKISKTYDNDKGGDCIEASDSSQREKGEVPDTGTQDEVIDVVPYAISDEGTPDVLQVAFDARQTITNAKVKGAAVDGPIASISGKNLMNCSAGRAHLMDPLSATMLKHLKDLGAKCRKFKKGMQEEWYVVAYAFNM
ncbi:hypothetical protein Cgig2_008297 [Carnegiea gigantea]|uniref:Uncharacterized protein n=1 Tax=Carnegiea gigantea TaxID=171969 RepID=A0A9Q1GYE8_9CARY|nr:hypothetical protein Cgig2_008297 [Carnegiea gigantea]